MVDGSDSRYELLDLIGAGGMAEVYRAKMVGAAGFEKLVAIKTMAEDCSKDEEFVDRFIDEARLTAHLVHPNICQILDFGVMHGRHFITMEYVDGLDLAAIVQGLDRGRERMPLDVVLAVTGAILRGLDFVHSAKDSEGRPLGIVHRDVSPNNVLLSVNGDIKVSDLGAATANPAVRATRTQKHFRLGKVLYMAPEQRKMQGIDGRADVYSTGVLLTEMVLGMTRFQKVSNMYLAGLSTLDEEVAEELPGEMGAAFAKVIGQATDPEPDKRFQSAGEMLAAIKQLRTQFAPGSSLDRVARLVQRLKRDMPKAMRHTDASAPYSIRTGDIEGVEEDQGLEEPPTLRGKQSPLNLVPYPAQATGLSSSTDEAPTVARGPSAPPDPPELESDDEGEDFEELATQTMRAPESPPHGSRPAPTPAEVVVPARQTPRKGRRNVAIVVVLLVMFLCIGLIAGLYVGTIGGPPDQAQGEPATGQGDALPTKAAGLMPSSAHADPPDASMADATMVSSVDAALPSIDALPIIDPAQLGAQLTKGDSGPSATDVRDTKARKEGKRAKTQPRKNEATGFGSINIGSRPVGVPYIDGTRVAEETPVGNVKASTGSHRVKVFFPQANRHIIRTVQVVDGQPAGVFIVLE